jgi:hypothetical protein
MFWISRVQHFIIFRRFRRCVCLFYSMRFYGLLVSRIVSSQWVK